MASETPREEQEALYELLERLLRRMTRRAWATPRQMQVDVGAAISMVTRMAPFPRQAILKRTLPDLLRELGSRRPDLHRYVLVVEETVHEFEEDLGLRAPRADG